MRYEKNEANKNNIFIVYDSTLLKIVHNEFPRYRFFTESKL